MRSAAGLGEGRVGEIQGVAAGQRQGRAGVIAFERTSDPKTGEFEPPVVIARYGDTPDDLY